MVHLSRRQLVVALLGLAGVATFVFAYGALLGQPVWCRATRGPFVCDEFALGMLFVVPYALAVYVLSRWMAAKSDDALLGRIVLMAGAAKVVGAGARYIGIFVIDGSGDAGRYAAAGARIALDLRHLDLGVPLSAVTGTTFMEVLTGVIFAASTPTRMGGFLVFSFFSLLGLCLFVLAQRPWTDARSLRVYACVVLFLPSLLYWPSSIGKEAWMLMALGLAFYGISGLVAGQPGALRAVLIGVALVSVVRIHAALLLVPGVLIAVASRPVTIERPLIPAGLTKAALTLLLVLGGFGIAVGTQSQFGEEDDDTIGGVTAALDTAADRTATGGSEFAAVRVRTPLDLPMATLTVLFRPLPHEVASVVQLIVSAEGLVLLGLALWRLPMLARNLATKSPWVLISGSYCLLFIIAFSTFANFGLLARQRVQVIPVVLALFVIPMSGKAVTFLHRPSSKPGPAPSTSWSSVPGTRTVARPPGGGRSR